MYADGDGNARVSTLLMLRVTVKTPINVESKREERAFKRGPRARRRSLTEANRGLWQASTRPSKLPDLAVPANEELVLENVKGKAMEIEVEIDPMKAREVGLNVFRSPDAREMTSVTLFMDGWPRDENARDLMIDVSKASLDPTVYARSPEVGPVTLRTDG